MGANVFEYKRLCVNIFDCEFGYKCEYDFRRKSHLVSVTVRERRECLLAVVSARHLFTAGLSFHVFVACNAIAGVANPDSLCIHIYCMCASGYSLFNLHTDASI